MPPGHSLGGLRMVMDITERKRAAARIEHMALHDGLTGLPNRLLLQDRADQTLARAKRYSTSFALVLMDLDRFKQINDTLGHAIGDEVLKVVAQRLTHAVRTSDTVVRMGGDEFALLLPDILHPDQAIEVGQKILAAMVERPVDRKPSAACHREHRGRTLSSSWNRPPHLAQECRRGDV